MTNSETQPAASRAALPALGDRSLRDFCRALADASPTPSGGSMAAAIGALGAAGISMTLRSADGEGAPWQAGRADELAAISERLCDLVERDAAIYDKVVAARSLAEDDPERAGALDKAYRSALETPAEMMEACVAGARLAAAGAPAGLPHTLLVDCLAGAEALRAGFEGAYLMACDNAVLLAAEVGGAESVDALVADAHTMRAELARLVEDVRAATTRAAEPGTEEAAS